MNGARGTALDFTNAFRQAEAHVERAAALVPREVKLDLESPAA